MEKKMKEDNAIGWYRMCRANLVLQKQNISISSTSECGMT